MVPMAYGEMLGSVAKLENPLIHSSNALLDYISLCLNINLLLGNLGDIGEETLSFAFLDLYKKDWWYGDCRIKRSYL